MTKAHRLLPRKKPTASTIRTLDKNIKLNFLLGCPQGSLGAFELARLAECDNLRRELHVVLDRLIDETSQAALAGWFRTIDRNVLKAALENPEDVLEWAQLRISRRGRTDAELVPLPALPPGAAHLAAALRYQERNVSEGKCAVCPQPLARTSVRYCEKHLTAARLRMTPSKGKPGSRGWLYGETEESTHGRQPGSLAAMAMGREQRTRALLAEAGLTAESAAVSLKAALEALMKCMPDSEAGAMTQPELFERAVIPTETTGRSALKELVAAGAVQRIGKGGKGDPFRYFKATAAASVPGGLRSLAEKKRGRE